MFDPRDDAALLDLLAALDAGNGAEHDRLAGEATRRLAECDVVALAQFSLARAAIEEDRAEGVGLADALSIIATLARDDLSFQSEVRANFARLRGTALLIFAFPFLMTFLYRLVDPDMVDRAYATPLGWLVAVAVALACAVAYWVVTLGERGIARHSMSPEAR